MDAYPDSCVYTLDSHRQPGPPNISPYSGLPQEAANYQPAEALPPAPVSVVYKLHPFCAQHLSEYLSFLGEHSMRALCRGKG